MYYFCSQLAKKALLIVGMSFFMTGCSSLLPPAAPAPDVYDLGLPKTLSGKQSTTEFSQENMVVVSAVQANGLENGLGIIYRYTNIQGNEPQQYAHARWAQHPAEALRFRMLQYLGTYYPVALNTNYISPNNWDVRFILEEFSQNISSDTQSSGVVQMRVTLGQGNSFMGQKTFRSEVPAMAVNVQAGVEALSLATDDILTQITQWVHNKIQASRSEKEKRDLNIIRE